MNTIDDPVTKGAVGDHQHIFIPDTGGVKVNGFIVAGDRPDLQQAENPGLSLWHIEVHGKFNFDRFVHFTLADFKHHLQDLCQGKGSMVEQRGKCHDPLAITQHAVIELVTFIIKGGGDQPQCVVALGILDA